MLLDESTYGGLKLIRNILWEIAAIFSLIKFILEVISISGDFLTTGQLNICKPYMDHRMSVQ